MPLRRTIKHYNKAPSRRLAVSSPKNANLRPLQTPAVLTPGAINVATITLNFNEPVVWNGALPPVTVNGASVIQTIVQNSPTQFTTTWSATLVGKSPMSYPFQDPTFRTYQGGYVQAGSFPIA